MRAKHQTRLDDNSVSQHEPNRTGGDEVTAITGIHPYADKFPMLPADEHEALRESIRTNGLRNPVVTDTEGQIIDGRNRNKACDELGIEPEVIVYEGDDIAEYVIDCNSARRHMPKMQRAMCDALVLDADGKRQARRWKYGETAEKLSELNSASYRVMLSMAGTVIDFKPDVAAKVASGEVSLTDAYEEAKAIKDSEERDKILERERRKREKEEAAEEAERNAQIIADLEQAESKYLPMIHDGTMKPASAWAAHRADNKKELDRQAAERRNDEQQARMVCAALAKLEFLDYDTQREWCITSISEYPNAVPDRDRSFHTPERIRHYAGMLSTYADEVEAADAA